MGDDYGIQCEYIYVNCIIRIQKNQRKNLLTLIVHVADVYQHLWIENANLSLINADDISIA